MIRQGGGNHRFAAPLVALVCCGLAGQASGADPSAWADPVPAAPKVLLVRGATIWTSASAGVLENSDLLVRDGKIAAIGPALEAPTGAVLIDARGKHVTPGIIDAHSHTAITGNVNESTNIVTAEVRIADVLDAEDINLYRELAGGLTAANVLHGSANAIGGQNAVIKLRWGVPADQLVFKEAPAGIKFALGENPKQSNFQGQQGQGQRPGPRRYPQTRMGIEQAIRERFLAAQDYRRAWEEQRKNPKSSRVPPKRDLQLEALVEILDGKRLVHAHSYRADEILMLLRLADEFGFRVATFQHVLEGYKVADEIAAHGSGASSFSDWWAYKYEVIDGIPYNGTILWRRGVVTTFNSDSDELARRLNLEAAKAVRYGGVPEAEALKFVTINSAKQLGIDSRVGSLEAGKDADFVVWSGHPLSTLSVCEQTWIDGRKYFDRAADLANRAALDEERRQLIEKVRQAKKKKDDDKSKAKPEDRDKEPHPPSSTVSTSGVEGAR